jgi:CBS domain-containing membrane protein
MKGRLRSLIGIELNEVSWREKMVSTFGGMIAIMLLVKFTHEVLDLAGAACVIASMGASAVLLFGVPHGQLSQPWPVLAGHGISACIGVVCQKCIPVEWDWLAAGLAVGLAIFAMHQLKCIHPPGGATALTAVLGGEGVRQLGWSFVCFPVLTNSLIMLVIAVGFNWFFKWRRYPAALIQAQEPASARRREEMVAPSHDDILSALRSVDSFMDITEEDLIRLSGLIERSRNQRLSSLIERV